MQEIKIECPGCHQKYNLKVGNPALLAGEIFNCKKCRFSAPFPMVLNSKRNSSLNTHIANADNKNGKTQVAGQKTRMSGLRQDACMALVVEKTGMRFPLYPGVYIVGRDSRDSRATLKLAPDPYMSRQHARLEVIPQAGTMRCLLFAMESSNPIYINNKKITAGTGVTLRSGDRLLFGMTTVTFSSGNPEKERTIW